MPINRKLQNIIGTEHITDAAETAIAAQASGGATVAFKNVAVSGQDNVVADAATDTLNIAAGANVTVTTNAGTDTVTIAAAGGSPGGSDGQMQYNNGGSFGGSSLVYTDTTDAEQFKIDVSSSVAPLVLVQTGSGNSFEVHDAADPDNNRFQIDASGNVTIKGLNGGGFGEALYVAGNTISERFKAEQGTASNNSFSHAQDTNTGVHFPAADNLAFATGGTERLRVSSSGEIGIAGANYGTAGQVLTSGGSGAAVSWASAGVGGAFASLQDMKPQPDSDRLYESAVAGVYQKTLGGAPFFQNFGSWSTVAFTNTDFRDGSDNTFVVMWPYLGSGETMVKSRAYRVGSSGQDNDTELNFVWYASDAKGLPTGAPVNSGICTLTNSVSAGAAVLEASWTNGPTLTAGELYWFGVFIDTTSSDASHTTDMGSIRATPSFEQEALGFSDAQLLLNNSNFGRVTGLRCTTTCGTTNGSRTAPTIGAGSIRLATGAGFNIPRVSFEVTYS